MIEPKGRYIKYPQYRKPDADWLEDIPIHWDIAKVKTLLCLEKGQVGEDSINHQLLSLTLGGVIPRNIANGGKLPAEFNTYQVVEPGNLVFCLFDIDETPRTVGHSAHNGMITGAYNVYSTTPKADGKFIFYYFLHIDSFKGLKPYYTGLRKVVRSETFGSIKMPLPPLSEQSLVANFLDHETAKIDILIDKQQKLIKLLKEKRQAVISHAVTKGLNPDAPMKDSGVEWLGEVPEHWDVLEIKRICQVKRGASPRPIDDQKYFDENGKYAWVRIADVSRAGMYLTDTTQRLSDLGSSLSVKLDAGKLFVSIAGTVGKPCLTIDFACIHDGFVYFTSLEINNLFLYFIFEAGEAYKGLGKMGTQLNLNTDTVGEIKIALPPSDEIDNIVKSIESQKYKYQGLVDKAECSINLMHERRTALISAAVTGKIDVRNWQPTQTETPMEASV